MPGFDPRRLLKIELEGLQAREVEAIAGLRVVSEEGKKVTVLFATEDGLTEFARRLSQMAAGRVPTRKDILWAVQRIDHIAPEDRTGPALTREGVPARERFHLDVELWPLELANERRRMLAHFKGICAEEGVVVLDTVSNEAVVLARVDTTQAGLELLLNMRDVREVDLPPRYQLDFSLVRADVAVAASVEKPAADAPRIAVLDTGVATAHPLIAPAMGEATGFGESGDAEDSTGHGTHIGGIALYGDIERAIKEDVLDPGIWLLSGRISDDDGNEETVLLERRVAEAVAYFKKERSCRVFNLSFGDARRPYRGGHVDRFAATLDALAREHGVLFVVSAGNFDGSGEVPANWRDAYPEYLLCEEARIIDPAPALNALTVGSLAHYETSRQSVNFPQDPAHQPIARKDEPSPFTRSGFGPRGAIKPELVEYGGNAYVDTRIGARMRSPGRELGVLSTSREFATGRLLTLDIGTSQAAAKVSNLAGRLLREYPNLSANVLRALLVAHAEVPEAASERLVGDKESVLRLLGYGLPREEESTYSSESRVTLVAEGRIAPNENHFYELPLPEDFFATPARRPRRITVALSHMPRVRRSRLEYKECALSFRVVRENDLDAVARAYRRQAAKGAEPNIPEQHFSPSPNLRVGGTVQCASRTLGQVDKRLRDKPYFVVVTSSVPEWAAGEALEPYALVVVIEDCSEQEVRMYSQIRAELRARARGRARAQA